MFKIKRKNVYSYGDIECETESGIRFIMGYDDKQYNHYLENSMDATDPCVSLQALHRQGQALVDEFHRCAINWGFN